MEKGPDGFRTPPDQTPPVSARLELILHGRVQGVGMRAFVSRYATKLGLTGYVKNQWDGTVAIVAEGPRDALHTLLAVVSEGPSWARITRVESRWAQATGEFKRFSVF